MSLTPENARHRMEAHVRTWRVTVERTLETNTSLVALGTCHDQPVVLKVLKHREDEWYSGQILEAFHGKGAARVYEHVDGALLVERLIPGNSLVSMVLEGKDQEATEILADVMLQMSACQPPERCATLETWAGAFERYSATGDNNIPKDFVEQAHRLYRQLSASQQTPRLLHGDLQHYNVLLDTNRGWLAIDPKGVVGELEYEIGAVLRNPIEKPDLFSSRRVIERRIRQFEKRLNVNFERTLAWGFAQAVLSTIWNFEDGFPADAGNPCMSLADTIRPMLTRGDLPLTEQ